MDILIDAGNTRLKVGWVNTAAARGATDAGPGGTVTAGPPALPSKSLAVPCAFDNNDTDAFAAWLDTLPAAPRRALGSNVAGPARAAAIEAALARHGCAIEWITPRKEALGLTSRYQYPERLGSDRWAAMLGVLSRLPAPRPAFLLASFGTATTLDTVGAEGVFEGGLILPGPVMMRRALESGTADLPLARGKPVLFPIETHAAIATGVAAAQAGAVVRQWLAARQRYEGRPPALYVAGGGWHEVEAETRRLLAQVSEATGDLPCEPQVVDNPVLDGLASLLLAQTAAASSA
ncbi:pantothenate kinase [Bordetella genomosp. 10]|uniref:Type III pantothenate kinase n=1 Tax=Bordetella genomosp. 10 TaxID=1416804 RepID=A0A261S4Y8_9BORD|nr:type III pantothenate kinase [Bordetella genomosp. 10]OZI32027.1 pantothenate kinase [Bordetella genomosp. 10]